MSEVTPVEPPPSPTGCIRVRMTSISMKFMWTAPVVDVSANPITNYRLTLTPADGSHMPYDVPASVTECTVNGLVINVQYTATVVASNDGGQTFGPEGIFQPFTLNVIMPTAPMSGGFMYASPTEVMLSWSPPADDGGQPISRYQMIFTPSIGVPDVVNVESNTTYYALKDLQHGINITAVVRATNNNGVTYGPDFQFAPIIPILPPAAPPASASAVGAYPGVVNVSWEPPAIAAEGNAYYLVMSQSSNPSDPLVGLGTRDMMDLSGCLRELNPESSYTFTVQIVNQVGRSALTTTNLVPPTKDLPPPVVAAAEPEATAAEPVAEPPAE